MNKQSPLYRAAKWAYVPVKLARATLKAKASAGGHRAKVGAYMATPGFKGLQIGSGPNLLKGWLNSDVAGFGTPEVVLDITRTLPIGDDALDAIYGSEVIEHIAVAEVEAFVKEAYRTLKPGGVLRLTTPDVAAVCGIALGQNERSTIPMHATTWKEADRKLTPSVWVNAMFRRWGHQHLWDFPSLNEALAAAGFAKVERVPPQMTHTRYAELANLENRYGVPAPPHCWESSMVVEATK